MKNAILFDGENIRTIDLDYFFQDEWIANMSKQDVEEAYINTLTLQDVTEQLLKDPETRESQPDIDKIKRGNSILRGMLRDMYGDHDALKIINKIENIHYETLR